MTEKNDKRMALIRELGKLEKKHDDTKDRYLEHRWERNNGYIGLAVGALQYLSFSPVERKEAKEILGEHISYVRSGKEGMAEYGAKLSVLKYEISNCRRAITRACAI